MLAWLLVLPLVLFASSTISVSELTVEPGFSVNAWEIIMEYLGIPELVPCLLVSHAFNKVAAESLSFHRPPLAPINLLDPAFIAEFLQLVASSVSEEAGEMVESDAEELAN